MVHILLSNTLCMGSFQTTIFMLETTLSYLLMHLRLPHHMLFAQLLYQTRSEKGNTTAASELPSGTCLEANADKTSTKRRTDFFRCGLTQKLFQCQTHCKQWSAQHRTELDAMKLRATQKNANRLPGKMSHRFSNIQ